MFNNQSVLYNFIKAVLKQLGVPFVDPCDPNYVGDCGDCGTGGGGGDDTDTKCIPRLDTETNQLCFDLYDVVNDVPIVINFFCLDLPCSMDRYFAPTPILQGGAAAVLTYAQDVLEACPGSLLTTDLLTGDINEPSIIWYYDGTNVTLLTANGLKHVDTATLVPVVDPLNPTPAELAAIDALVCPTVNIGDVLFLQGNPDYVWIVAEDTTFGTCRTTRVRTRVKEEDHGLINYVSVNGDDATAIQGNSHYPYQTIAGAVASAAPGDTVDVFHGEYAEIVKVPDGITLVLREGVELDGSLDIRGSDIKIYSRGHVFNDTIPPLVINPGLTDIRIRGIYESLSAQPAIFALSDFVADEVIAITAGPLYIDGTANVVVYNSYANVEGGYPATIIYQVDAFTEDINVQ